MAISQISASLNLFIHDVSGPTTRSFPQLHSSSFTRTATSFLRGSPPVMQTSSCQVKTTHRARTVLVRCEQSANKGSNLDVWLGRLAMTGFAVAISVEIATGKGLLENVGLTTPLPTVALAVTAVVGVLTAIFIFQSASKN
ncbi:hypothetical protein Ancab_028282 [Ancistrocladus abbreviatus]